MQLFSLNEGCTMKMRKPDATLTIIVPLRARVKWTISAAAGYVTSPEEFQPIYCTYKHV